MSQNIVVDASAQAAVPVTYTVTHPATLKAATFRTGPVIYRGTSVSSTAIKIVSDDPGTCTAASTTVLNCKATITIRPSEGDLLNSYAGTRKGATAYTTVKSVRTSSTGTLRSTVTASVDGYNRFAFAGSATSPAVSAAGDFVDVQ